jgi:multidrug resistance efflux pump
VRSDADLKPASNRIVSIYEQLLSQKPGDGTSSLNDLVAALPRNLLRLRNEIFEGYIGKTQITRLKMVNQDLQESLNQEIMRHTITDHKRAAAEQRNDELLAKVQNLSDQLKEWQWETKRLEGKLEYFKKESSGR